MKFTLEQPSGSPEDFPLEKIRIGEFGVVTSCPNGTLDSGRPVIGAGSTAVFPCHRGRDAFVLMSKTGYKFRRLFPGERAVFEGE